MNGGGTASRRDPSVRRILGFAPARPKPLVRATFTDKLMSRSPEKLGDEVCFCAKYVAVDARQFAKNPRTALSAKAEDLSIAGQAVRVDGSVHMAIHELIERWPAGLARRQSHGPAGGMWK